MADTTIYLKKRLIGKEDINFDATGLNEHDIFITSDGSQKKVTKINATHLPLTKEARDKLNAVNVENALELIADKIKDSEAGDVLTENITVEFLSEDTAETIQLKINQQKKNLNGYTITFVFPQSLQQNLYQSIIWQDFSNGTVLISGGSSGSPVIVYDQQNIESLFKIHRCFCEVRISYFHFVHQKSLYGVKAESSSAVILDHCSFSGIEDTESYAVAKIASNAYLIDCQFSNDLDVYPYVRNDYLPLSGGTMTGDILSTSDRTLEIIAGQNKNTAPSISLIGGNVPISDEKYDIRGGIEFTAKDGTGNQSNTLLLLPNGTLMLNGVDIISTTTGYPNYAAAVELGNISSYTAEQDGWVNVYNHSASSYLLYVNDIIISYDYSMGSVFIPVKKGDVVKTMHPSYPDNEITVGIFNFFPNITGTEQE